MKNFIRQRSKKQSEACIKLSESKQFTYRNYRKIAAGDNVS